MLKYAKITNEETKEVSVGIGTNETYFKKIGYKLMEVEKSYNDNWYLEGHAPIQTLNELKQIKLDELRWNNENYILSTYPEHRQRNIGIFGTDEERNAFKSFKDNQIACYDGKIEEINNCENSEELSKIEISTK
jgi:hypothetical protein